jgi:hypothetical protein
VSCSSETRKKIKQKKERKPIASLWFAILFLIPFPRLKLAIPPVRQFHLGEKLKTNATLRHINEKEKNYCFLLVGSSSFLSFI